MPSEDIVNNEQQTNNIQLSHHGKDQLDPKLVKNKFYLKLCCIRFGDLGTSLVETCNCKQDTRTTLVVLQILQAKDYRKRTSLGEGHVFRGCM